MKVCKKIKQQKTTTTKHIIEQLEEFYDKQSVLGLEVESWVVKF